MTVKQFLEQIRDDSIEDGNLWTAELAKACIADYDAQSLELQAVREALRELTDALGMGTPWPLLDVLKTLQDAGEHLLTAHGCDKHGHENTRAAVEQAKALGPRIFAALKQSRGAT